MRYLTGHDAGLFGLEEAIAWEQLRGMGATPDQTYFVGEEGRGYEPGVPSTQPKPPVKKPGIVYQRPTVTPPLYMPSVYTPGFVAAMRAARPLVTKAPTPARRPVEYLMPVPQPRPVVPAVAAPVAARLAPAPAVADVLSAPQLPYVAATEPSDKEYWADYPGEYAKIQAAQAKRVTQEAAQAEIHKYLTVPPPSIWGKLPTRAATTEEDIPAYPVSSVRTTGYASSMAARPRAEVVNLDARPRAEVVDVSNLPPIITLRPDTRAYALPTLPSVTPTPATLARIQALKQSKAVLDAQIAADYRGTGSASKYDEAQSQALAKTIKSMEALKTAGGFDPVRQMDVAWNQAVEGGNVKLMQSMDDISFIKERTDAEAATGLSTGERGFMKEFMPLAVNEAREKFLKTIYAGAVPGENESSRAAKVEKNIRAMGKPSDEDLEIERLIKTKGESSVDPEKLLTYKIKQQAIQTYAPMLKQLGMAAHSYAANIGSDPSTAHDSYNAMAAAINKMENVVSNGSAQAITEKFLDPVFREQALDHVMNNVLQSQMDKLSSQGKGTATAVAIEQTLSKMPQSEASRITGNMIAEELTSKIGKMNYSRPDKVVSQIIDVSFDIYSDAAAGGARKELLEFLRAPIAMSVGFSTGYYLQKAYAAAKSGNVAEAQRQMNEASKVLSAGVRQAVAYTYTDEPKFAKMADKLATAQIGGSWLGAKAKQIIGASAQPAVAAEPVRGVGR